MQPVKLFCAAAARISATLLLLQLPCPLEAQMPFYTDDVEVTPHGTVHVEVFDEIDALQSSQFPDLRQNTDNFKVNVGLPYRFEADVDAPYLSINRAQGVRASRGLGDTEFGIKWKARDASPSLRLPSLAASFYIEVPTGNARDELGSGLTDYWLNLIAQEPLSERTRINLNVGILFAGNTSTGVIGVETTRGQVYTGGLSVLHDLSDRVSLGVELYGGVSSNDGLHRQQLQAMFGAQYNVRDNVALCAGLVAGRFTASPRLGAQLGFEVDFPQVFGRPSKSSAPLN